MEWVINLLRFFCSNTQSINSTRYESFYWILADRDVTLIIND